MHFKRGYEYKCKWSINPKTPNNNTVAPFNAPIISSALFTHIFTSTVHTFSGVYRA